jgi:hypothetical protein
MMSTYDTQFLPLYLEIATISLYDFLIRTDNKKVPNAYNNYIQQSYQL